MTTTLQNDPGAGAPANGAPEVGVRFVCLTTWPSEARTPVTLTGLPGSEDEEAQLADALALGSTTWCEFEFVGSREALRWFEPALEPWDGQRRPVVRWRDVHPVLDLLGIKAPDLGGTSSVSEALAVLPLVYTLGVRRARSELKSHAAAVELFPAMGFQRPNRARSAWTNRVCVAAVDRFVFTARLPSRLWPPGSEADEDEVPSATLVVKERFVPTGGRPTPAELAQGIAIYQAATCGTIVTREQQRLREIEALLLELMLHSEQEADEKKETLSPAKLGGSYRELFELSERGEHLEHEVARLCARFDDPGASDEAAGVRRMFEEALRKVHAFQTDIRQRTDCIAGMVATQQFALAEQSQEATDKFQKRATIVGSAVLVPALVAAVFGANVALPGEEQEGGLVAMLFLMIALGAGTWWGIFSLDHKNARLTARPWKPEFAHVHAGFFLAVTSLAFGVVALTPAADQSLGGAQALGATVGVLLIALGIGAAVWGAINRRRPQESGRDRPLVPRFARATAWAAPAAIAIGVFLAVLLFVPELAVPV